MNAFSRIPIITAPVITIKLLSNKLFENINYVTLAVWPYVVRNYSWVAERSQFSLPLFLDRQQTDKNIQVGD